MVRRMLTVLPAGWFGDNSPNLQSVLSAIGAAWAAIYSLIQACIQQTRIATATDGFLDLISQDFFGSALPRLASEQDNAFRGRVTSEILRPRATREAIVQAVAELTGHPPLIFEPARPTDTGGYAVGGVGYATAGGWGNLELPFQFFISIFRPSDGNTAFIAGYGGAGCLSYGSSSLESAALSDGQIVEAIPPLLPAGTIAWARLLN